MYVLSAPEWAEQTRSIRFRGARRIYRPRREIGLARREAFWFLNEVDDFGLDRLLTVHKHLTVVKTS